ncbi:MAG: hypothetical protein ACYTFD_10825 [Planctomycetota bacterium]|jgi:tetratricopeptide (TPR) repeat protein
MRYRCIALLLLLPAALRAEDERKPITFELLEPVEGKPHHGPLTFGAKLNGGPSEKPLTIIVRCFDVTHHIHIMARMSLLGEMPDVELKDDLWPMSAGEQTLAVSVWVKDEPDALFETEIKFTVAEPEPEPDEQKLDRIRYSLHEALSRVWGTEETYRRAARYARKGGPPEKVTEAENAVHRARVNELLKRIEAYADAAELYEERFDTEGALRALTFAQEIFQKERDEVGVHPRRPDSPTLFVDKEVCFAPAHFAAFARYHTRRNDLDGAVRHWKQEAQWYEKQLDREDLDEKSKNTCRKRAREAYEQMASVHVLLRNDTDESEACLEKARKLQPKSTG